MLNVSNLNEVAKILGVKPEEVTHGKIKLEWYNRKPKTDEWEELRKALIELDKGHAIKRDSKIKEIDKELKDRIANLSNLNEVAKILGVKPEEVTHAKIRRARRKYRAVSYEGSELRKALIELDNGNTERRMKEAEEARKQSKEEHDKREVEELAKEAYVKPEALRTKLMSDDKLFDKAKKITGLSKIDILSVKGFMNKNKKNIKRKDRRVLESTLIRLSKEELSDEMKKKLRVPRLVNKVKRVVKKTLKFAFNSTVAFLGYLFLPEIPILKGVTNFVYILVP